MLTDEQLATIAANLPGPHEYVDVEIVRELLKDRSELEAAYAKAQEIVLDTAHRNLYLEEQVFRLRRWIHITIDLGHNDDCLFCGLKDKRLHKVLEDGE